MSAARGQDSGWVWVAGPRPHSSRPCCTCGRRRRRAAALVLGERTVLGPACCSAQRIGCCPANCHLDAHHHSWPAPARLHPPARSWWQTACGAGPWRTRGTACAARGRPQVLPPRPAPAPPPPAQGGRACSALTRCTPPPGQWRQIQVGGTSRAGRRCQPHDSMHTSPSHALTLSPRKRSVASLMPLARARSAPGASCSAGCCVPGGRDTLSMRTALPK